MRCDALRSTSFETRSFNDHIACLSETNSSNYDCLALHLRVRRLAGHFVCKYVSMHSRPPSNTICSKLHDIRSIERRAAHFISSTLKAATEQTKFMRTAHSALHIIRGDKQTEARLRTRWLRRDYCSCQSPIDSQTSSPYPQPPILSNLRNSQRRGD